MKKYLYLIKKRKNIYKDIIEYKKKNSKRYNEFSASIKITHLKHHLIPKPNKEYTVQKFFAWTCQISFLVLGFLSVSFHLIYFPLKP